VNLKHDPINTGLLYKTARVSAAVAVRANVQGAQAVSDNSKLPAAGWAKR
jgi:hypothetical protein